MSVILCNENQKSVWFCFFVQSTHARWERLPGYSNVRDGLIVCITHCLLFFQDGIVRWLQWKQAHNSLLWQSKQPDSFESESDLVVSFGCKMHMLCRPQVSIVTETRHFECLRWTKFGSWFIPCDGQNIYTNFLTFAHVFLKTSRNYFKHKIHKIT